MFGEWLITFFDSEKKDECMQIFTYLWNQAMNQLNMNQPSTSRGQEILEKHEPGKLPFGLLFHV